MSQQKPLKRLNLKCWSCQKTFELSVDVTGKPLFNKECPFCSERCTFDLNPYRRSTVEVLRGNEINLETERLELPKTIPTAKPDNDEDGAA